LNVNGGTADSGHNDSLKKERNEIKIRLNNKINEDKCKYKKQKQN
jgi:hypothetical protein